MRAITGRLADDLGDQIECVLGAEPEADERDIWTLSRGRGADLLDVNLTCDHLVAQPSHDPGEQFEPLPLLVRDQDAELVKVG
jgi:hypothetical protein